MPAGKMGVLGGSLWVTPLSHAVSVRSLRKYVKGRGAPPKLSFDELKACRERLRLAVCCYRIASVTPHATVTSVRQDVAVIKTNAARFVSTPNRVWSDRLLHSLETMEASTSKIVTRHLNKIGIPSKDLVMLKRDLFGLFFRTVYPGEKPPSAKSLSQAEIDRVTNFVCNRLPIVSALAEIDPDVVFEQGGRSSGRWPNPPLANLVIALESVWTRVTGRTAGWVFDFYAKQKTCLFADWLGEIISVAGGQAPLPSSVAKIVQSLKKGNQGHNTPGS